MTETGSERAHVIRSYIAGYLAAVVLILAAFAVVRWPNFGSTVTLAIVLALALIQMARHFQLLFNVSLKKSSRDNFRLIAFSVAIGALMIAGTLIALMILRHWIM